MDACKKVHQSKKICKIATDVALLKILLMHSSAFDSVSHIFILKHSNNMYKVIESNE